MAIQFDAVSAGGNNGASTTVLAWSHTCTGALGLLLVGVVGGSTTDTVTGVTYNGVPLTQVSKLAGQLGSPAGNRWSYLYAGFISAPDGLPHTIQVTASVVDYLFGIASSYTGVKQTGPDASPVSQTTPTGASTLTTSVVTTANNCWTMVLSAGYTGATNEPIAGTGSTFRVRDTTFGMEGLFDSGGPVTPAGSRSMTTTRAAAPSPMQHHMVAYAPDLGPVDYAALVALDGASGYWPLDDPMGTTTARDLAGTRTGTLHGGVLAGRRGLWGRAMEFSASTPGYIDLGGGAPALATAFSVDLWALRRTDGAASHVYICKGPPVFSPDGPPVDVGFFSFFVQGVRHLAVQANSPGAYFGVGAIDVAVGVWHHVAFTFTPAATTKLYVDGVLDTTVAMPFLPDDGSLVTYLGDFPYFLAQGYGWDGLMQAVAWYPTALTGAQVLAHYQTGLAQASTGLPLSVLQLADDDEDDDMLKYNIVTPITTSDTADLPRLTDAIYVGGNGDVSVVTQGGAVARVFTNVVGGSILPVVARRVNASGTTATALLALYRG